MDYYDLDARELGVGSAIPLQKMNSSQEVFEAMAREMADIIAAQNASGQRTVMICPVGPVGQYPFFAQMVNERRLNLQNCWFFNMDEYLTDEGAYIEQSSPLSFRGFMARNVYGRIDPELLMPPQQRVFPDPQNLARTDALLNALGGADAAFGGIGINGHLAFNEADAQADVTSFAALGTRTVRLTPETRTANAIADRGGAIDAMPSLAVTLGMRQILGARKVRLGVFREWHRAVVRRASYGSVGASFPATLLQAHPDARIYVNDIAAQKPFER